MSVSDHNPFEPIGLPSSGPVLITKQQNSSLSLARFNWQGGDEVMKSLPREDAYVVILHISGVPPHDYWMDGKHRWQTPSRPAINILDVNAAPMCRMTESFDNLHLHIPRAALDEISDEAGCGRVTSLCTPEGWDTVDPIAESMTAGVAHAIEQRDSVSRLFVDHMVLALNAHLVRTYGAIRAPALKRSGGLAPWQERRAKEFVAANLNQDISLNLVAGESGLSPSHFARSFKVSTGVTPHQWLQTCRVNRAKDLLLQPDTSLAEIAVQCGFADQSHFTRVFTRIAGDTPGAWRRARRAA